MSSSNGSPSPSKFSSAEKRAVHNALERKRRDHIKDMFSQLKDSVPNMAGEKISTKASRAQILKKACDYIQLMRRKNVISGKDVEELAHQILRTRRQIAKLESLRATNRYVDTLPLSTAATPSREENQGKASRTAVTVPVGSASAMMALGEDSSYPLTTGTPVNNIAFLPQVLSQDSASSDVQRVILTDMPGYVSETTFAAQSQV